jgi:hypothetical protein
MSRAILAIGTAAELPMTSATLPFPSTDPHDGGHRWV